MKLPNTKIESAVDIKDLRSNLSVVHFDAMKGRLLATDGHIAAFIPVLETGEDVAGPIPLNVIKDARKLKSDIHLREDLKLDNNATYPREHVSDFPVDQLDKMVDKTGAFGDNPRKVDIHFDARLLFRLAEAIIVQGRDKTLPVSLTFSRLDDGSIDPSSAIFVQGYGEDCGYGLLMPRRI